MATDLAARADVTTPVWISCSFHFTPAYPAIQSGQPTGVFRIAAYPFHADMRDCAQLVSELSLLMGQAEIADKWWTELGREGVDSDARTERLSETRRGHSNARVVQLSYGSPFELQALAALSPPGIALLVYNAKKLFGAKFELLAWREKRKAEFLEARKLVEKLEAERPIEPRDTQDDVRVDEKMRVDTVHWSLLRGVISEDSPKGFEDKYEE